MKELKMESLQDFVAVAAGVAVANRDDVDAIIRPLSTLQEISKWQPDLHLNCVSMVTLPTRPSGVRPRTLVCHDMAGGYLDDRFVQGVKRGDSYVFSHWSCVDTFVYFSHCLVTIPPPVWTNAAHRNGVAVLGTFITEWEAGKLICEEFLQTSQRYKLLADKLVAIAVYYGFDGWLINIENEITEDLVSNLVSFVAYLTDTIHSRLPNSTLIWYDSVTKGGKLDWQNELNKHNQCFFDVTDGIFINYTWTDDNLQQTAKAALSTDRPLDVYIGLDVFGRGCRGGGGFNLIEAMSVVRHHDLSVAIFAPSWTYEQFGGVNFLENDNRFWSYLHGDCARIKRTHVPQWYYTCVGQGQHFYQHGKILSNESWTNQSLQSVQLAYCTDLCPNKECKDIKVERYDQCAFQGGSCLKLSISSSTDLFSLFAIDIDVTSDDLIISYTFKSLSSAPSDCDVSLHLKCKNRGYYTLGVAAASHRVQQVAALEPSEASHLLGAYYPQDVDDSWITRYYKLDEMAGDNVEEIAVSFDYKEYHAECNLLIGQIQIFSVEDLHRPMSLTDLQYSTVHTDDDTAISIVISWTFPVRYASHFVIYYRLSDSDRFTYVGHAHCLMFKVSKLVLASSTKCVEFKVQPVLKCGLCLSLDALMGIKYNMPST